MNTKWEQKIEEVLASADQIKRAEAPAFFYTRLEARMSNKITFWERMSAFVSKPSVAIAGLTTLVILNAGIIFTSLKSENQAANVTELATVDEYAQLSATGLDFENLNP